jgi:60S ribosome subunit biogenesis protein NIP7
MRPLEESEVAQVFEKLFKFIGKNLKNVLDTNGTASRTEKDGDDDDDGDNDDDDDDDNNNNNGFCFRLHKQRVYYCREDVVRRATNVGRDQLVTLGQCVGKFTHSGKFRLTIGALDLLAKNAKHKMWVKPTSEMSFLYGNHLLKSGLGRVTENTPANQGVVIFSMSDVPLGFGVCAKSTQDCRKADPSAVVCFHQADIGEYLRAEDDMVPGKKE